MKCRTHMVIPDTQCKPGVSLTHLEAAGNYAVEKQPDVIIHLGDHWDMPSLSSYDPIAKIAREGRRYMTEDADNMGDIESGNVALDLFMAPLKEYNKGRRKKYTPRLVMLRGNHEHRITRRIEDDPTLRGAMGFHHFNDKAHGWEIHKFLKPVKIDGVYYAHYFYSPLSGRALGGTALYKLNKLKFSFTQGHVQIKDAAEQYLCNGTVIRGLVVGAFYQHDEDYIGPQGNNEWRGIIMKHEVRGGNYDLMEVSLGFLLRRYL